MSAPGSIVAVRALLHVGNHRWPGRLEDEERTVSSEALASLLCVCVTIVVSFCGELCPDLSEVGVRNIAAAALCFRPGTSPSTQHCSQRHSHWAVHRHRLPAPLLSSRLCMQVNRCHVYTSIIAACPALPLTALSCPAWPSILPLLSQASRVGCVTDDLMCWLCHGSQPAR